MDQQVWTVYVLELEHGKYYVGRTKRAVEQRLVEHRASRAGWVRAHHPLRVAMTFNNCDAFDEDKYTKMVMAVYGVENVRGGAYCQMELNFSQQRLLDNEIASAKGVCYWCQQEGHYVADCPRKERDEEDAARAPPVDWFQLSVVVTFLLYVLYFV